MIALNLPTAPLRQGVFRSIWLASIASNFGGLIQGVGAAWLMTSIAQSDDMVALVQASTALPIMLFSLLSGAIADLFARRRVMLVAQGFMLCVSALLAITAYLGLITPWLLLCFTFLIGCGTALNNPAWQASVGDIVPREDVPSAVALNSLGFNLTRSVGPAVGGLIVGAFGPAAAFTVNAIAYLAPIAAIFRWQPAETLHTLPREGVGSAVTAGLRYVAMSPNIEKVLVRSFAFGFTAVAIQALLPLVVRDNLVGGPFTFGVMLGCFGFGAIAGALASGFLRIRVAGETIVRGAFIGFAACAGLVGYSGSVFVTGPALLVGGACWVLALQLFNVTVQLSTPRWVVGRALAIYQTATFGGMALGAWIWGLVADGYGVDIALYGVGLAMLAGAAIGLWLPVPKHTILNLDPLNRWREPNLALDVKPRSGPIVIMVDYTVREENLPAFLETMAERRRIRRRDGARQWTLMRDLENPQLWTETYHTPTWLDYVRQSQRLTQADAEVTERLKALHDGTWPPPIHRLIERPTNWDEMILPRADLDLT